jgi:hypothetical protein
MKIKLSNSDKYWAFIILALMALNAYCFFDDLSEAKAINLIAVICGIVYFIVLFIFRRSE